MQIEDWPAARTAEFQAAFVMDPDGGPSVSLRAGSGSSELANAVAAVWNAVRGIADAAVMILTTRSQTWAAAGAVVVEGKPGLNVGLLMPSMRDLPQPEPSPPAEAGLPADPVQRTLWDAAVRLDQVEADRLLEFQAGGSYFFHAARAEFDLMEGATLDGFRKDVADTLAKGKRVRYRLLPCPDQPVAARHRGGEVICDSHEGRTLRLGMDLWPLAVPKGLRLDGLRTIRSVCDHLSTVSADDGTLLTVVDRSGRPAMKTRCSGTEWVADMPVSWI